MSHFPTSIRIHHGIISGPSEAIQQPQSIDDLNRKYPGVEFRHINDGFWIDINGVHIAAGPTICLNSGLNIQGQTYISADAVIEGGFINHSTIFGKVSGGSVRHSKVEREGHVLGGTINHSKIQGIVSGGTVNHCKVNGLVSGGTVNHSTINGRVHGGISNHITVRDDDVITEATTQLAQPQGPGRFSVIRGDVHQGAVWRSVIRGNVHQEAVRGSGIRGDVHQEAVWGSVTANTSNVGPNSPKAFTYKPSEVDHTEEFDTDPPQYLKDPVSWDLIHNAVVTRYGHTFDYHVIEEVIRRDGRCPLTREPLELEDLVKNHIFQVVIEEWKEMHRIRVRG
jgi:hypothetical protein